MLKTRVIPVLLLRDGGLVKGERFKSHKYVGDPINAVRIFNEKEADELIFLDISATSQNSGPDFSSVKDIASEAFMPIAYGGGITTIAQIEKLFRSGIEKVIINSAFNADRMLVRNASSIAGAQSVVVSIDVRKSIFGRYEVYTHGGTKKTGIDPVAYARFAQEAGAGELMITNIDNEGLALGYDLEMIRSVAAAVSIPVVAHGGASCLPDFSLAINEAGASAVAAGRFFTFHGKHKAVLITYPDSVDLLNLFKAEGNHEQFKL